MRTTAQFHDIFSKKCLASLRCDALPRTDDLVVINQVVYRVVETWFVGRESKLSARILVERARTRFLDEVPGGCPKPRKNKRLKA